MSTSSTVRPDGQVEMTSEKKTGGGGGGGHMLHPSDPENPLNLPLLRKLHVTFTASSFTFVLLFAVSSYSAGIPQIAMEFGVSVEKAILGLSIMILGIIPAPLLTPHISERVGRNLVYWVGLFLMSLFILGASRSKTYSAFLACRFFAGFFGGPIAVNIEGSYADVWSAKFTGTYYSFITASQYFGAATGAIVGGALVNDPTRGWRWTQYVTLMLALIFFIPALFTPETYGREILRRRAKKGGRSVKLSAAPSGETFSQMAYLTLIQPFMMLVSEPLVAIIALYMSLNFGVLFQWFVTVPATLTMLAKFDPRQDGLAFVSAIGGTVLAGLCTIALDQVLSRKAWGKTSHGVVSVEHRLVSAIVGSVLLAVSLFWVGNTAAPGFSYNIPIVGTAVYVWGSAMTLTGFIGYLFDAYSPQVILSALSIVAYARLATAAWVPLVIVPMTNNLTPRWGFNTFGIIASIFILIPIALFFFGARLRANSGYARKSKDNGDGMSPVVMEVEFTNKAIEA